MNEIQRAALARRYRAVVDAEHREREAAIELRNAREALDDACKLIAGPGYTLRTDGELKLIPADVQEKIRKAQEHNAQ